MAMDHECSDRNSMFWSPCWLSLLTMWVSGSEGVAQKKGEGGACDTAP